MSDTAIEALRYSEFPNSSDCISRKDAIDVAKQHWYKPDIAKALEELPSTLPEVLACGEGELSAQPEIIRCKDCEYFSMTTLGMPYACWKGADKIFGETGEHANHTVCRRIDSPDWFCADGERRSE